MFQIGGVKSGAPQKTSTQPPNKPQVMGQKKTPPKQGNQPLKFNVFSNIMRVINGLGYSTNVGVFNFNIKPNISKRRIGVQVNLGIDTSFIESFIPPQLQKFWQSITS